jgi:tRNA-binding EMAP/Myf-like protein
MEDPKLEVLSMEDVPPNSFILLKVDVAGPMEKMQAVSGIAESIRPFAQSFKNKNIVFMVLTPKESLSVLTEEEMNSIGWYRKEK